MVQSPRWSIADFAAALQTVLAFVLVTGLLITLSSGVLSSKAGFEDREGGTLLFQLAGIAVYLPSAIFLLARPDLPLRTLARSPSIVILHTLILMSVVWAVVPDVSLRRALAVLLQFMLVLHVACWFTPERFIRIAGWTLAGMMVLSILAVAVPGLGITPDGVHQGRLRGILPTKNDFGEVSAIAILTFVTLAAAERQQRQRRLMVVWLALAGVSLLALFASNSRTPLLALIAGVAVMWAAKFVISPAGWQTRLALSVRAGLVGTAVLFATVILPSALALVFSALGRTMTLSGRTKLWEYAIGKGMDRPWLGAGYKSFWVDKLTFDIRALHDHWSAESAKTKALTANAHNGYLDVWLELGVAGLVLFLLVIFGVMTKASSLFRTTADNTYLWYFGIFGFAVVYYIPESGAIGHNQMTWFVITYAFLSLVAQQMRMARGVRIPAAAPLQLQAAA